MRQTFRDALEAEKSTWVSCPHCRRKSEVSVPDWHARGKMIELMLTQGFGRPKQEEGEGSRGFTLVRKVVAPNGGV